MIEFAKCSIKAVNPLLHELFLSSILERQPRIGCYRLLTHRHGAHRKLFLTIPFYLKSKFWTYVHGTL